MTLTRVQKTSSNLLLQGKQSRTTTPTASAAAGNPATGAGAFATMKSMSSNDEGAGTGARLPVTKKQGRIIVVSNVLPIVFKRDEAGGDGLKATWNAYHTGVFYKRLVGSHDENDVLYVGCPEIYVPPHQEEMVTQALVQHKCIPVFLDQERAHGHFQGFCQGVLWPTFHNIVDVYNSSELHLSGSPRKKKQSPHKRNSQWIPPKSWNPASQDECWQDYCSVNYSFLKRIIEIFHEGDIIWIQDYHLLMLPSYLLRKLPGVNIALYLHAPFPSSEIFRSLSMREELLRSMLSANHLAFLLFEHARHFLTCCKRLLGLSYQSRPGGCLGVEYNGRHVIVTCSHMGTEINDIIPFMEKKPQPASMDALLRKIRDRRVIACVDRLEGLSGILLKLMAFDRFLSTYPARALDCTLVQIGLTLDSRPNDYQQILDQIHSVVHSINAHWGTPEHPRVYFEEREDMNCCERMALWKHTSVYLNTCVREGLNLYPFEYVLVHAHFASRGSLVMSEFASSSRVLNGARLINPWKASEVAEALEQCIEMKDTEIMDRLRIDYEFLEKNTISQWGDRILKDIKESAKQSEGLMYMGIGFGNNYRFLNFSSNLVRLDEDIIAPLMKTAEKRLFFLDFGGTLSSIQNVDHYLHKSRRHVGSSIRGELSSEMKEILVLLSASLQNVVFVVSNASKKDLMDHFEGIPNLGLIANNGYFYKKPNKVEWECLGCQSEELAWMSTTTTIMNTYVDRTNSAFLSVSEVSVIFDYRNSDPEFGELQANELCDELNNVLVNIEASVLRGKGFVEVHPFGINKGTSATLLLNYCKHKGVMPDFICCIGDDTSDEQAFKATTTFVESQSIEATLITCTVGKKPTEAAYFVDSPEDVQEVLRVAASQTRMVNKMGTEDDRGVDFRERFCRKGKLLSQKVTKALSPDIGKKVRLMEKFQDVLLVENQPLTSEAARAAPGASSTLTLHDETKLTTTTMTTTTTTSTSTTEFAGTSWATLGLTGMVGMLLGWQASKHYSKVQQFLASPWRR